MSDVEPLRQNLEEIGERLRAKTEEYDRETSRRTEIQTEIRGLAARAQEARQAASAAAFLPGRAGAAVAQADEEIEELERRIEETRTRVERLKVEKDALQEEQQEAARALARALVDPVLEAEERRREALARLGSAVLPAYVEYLEAIRDRNEVLSAFRGAVGAAAATSAQRRTLERHLQQEIGDKVAGEALLGVLLADLLTWARRVRRGPLAELWERDGIDSVEGSPRHARPVPAVEDALAAIEAGRLPGTPSAL